MVQSQRPYYIIHWVHQNQDAEVRRLCIGLSSLSLELFTLDHRFDKTRQA